MRAAFNALALADGRLTLARPLPWCHCREIWPKGVTRSGSLAVYFRASAPFGIWARLLFYSSLSSSLLQRSEERSPHAEAPDVSGSSSQNKAVLTTMVIVVLDTSRLHASVA